MLQRVCQWRPGPGPFPKAIPGDREGMIPIPGIFPGSHIRFSDIPGDASHRFAIFRLKFDIVPLSSPLRHIAHLDLDCFYVSVERFNDPSLESKPVVVGGSPQGRGVVASASYEARAFGVRSAMPTSQALRLCPQLIIVRGHHRQYGEISDKLYRRMTELAPVVERASIDEMYMDFSGTERLHGYDLPRFMHSLQQTVRKEFFLPCTISLSSNKLVSKIAANTVKPNGVITVPHGQEKTFLAPLPIGVIPGVGKKTEEFLLAKGFRTVDDVQQTSQEQLVKLLGKQGVWIYDAASGKGSTRVAEDHLRKSISREETFSRDIGGIVELERILHDLTTDVCATLRKKNLRTRKVSVKLRYSDFTTLTRDRSVEEINGDPEIFRVASDLLRQNFDLTRKLRLIGIRLSSLVEIEQLELDLVGRGSKDRDILTAVDKLRKRFGDDVISLGKTE